MIGQGNGSLYVFACTRVASVDKLVCGCSGSKPKIDGEVIFLHSVFLIGVDTWKNNFNKFAPKERKRGGGRGERKGGTGSKTERERAGREKGRGGRGEEMGNEREIEERKMLYLQEFFMN